MKRPIEADYVSYVAYGRALEEYCTSLEQAEPVPWQPIETAPKDSQDRLFYKQGIISQAKWLGEGKGFGGDHWSYDAPTNIANGFNNQPSHWMPLPPAPVVPKSQRAG